MRFFAGFALPFLGVGGRIALHGDIGPDLGVFGIECQPLFEPRHRVGLDRIDRAFGFTDAAIDAFVRMDDEHVLAFVEAIYGADFDAIHVFASNAAIVDDVGHVCGRYMGSEAA